MEPTKIAPPRVPVTLVGQDSNVFVLMGICRRVAMRGGWTTEQWEEVRNEMTSGDYDQFLQTAMKYFEVD